MTAVISVGEFIRESDHLFCERPRIFGVEDQCPSVECDRCQKRRGVLDGIIRAVVIKIFDDNHFLRDFSRKGVIDGTFKNVFQSTTVQTCGIEVL